jgi:uncharacterized protein YhaN
MTSALGSDLERQLVELERARDEAQREYEEAHERAGRLRRAVIHAEADVALAAAEGRDTETLRRIARGVRAEFEDARRAAEPLLDRFLGVKRAAALKRDQLGGEDAS